MDRCQVKEQWQLMTVSLHQGSNSKHLLALTHVLINWKNGSAR